MQPKRAEKIYCLADHRHAEVRASLEAILKLLEIIETHAGCLRSHTVDAKAFIVRTRERIEQLLGEIR